MKATWLTGLVLVFCLTGCEFDEWKSKHEQLTKQVASLESEVRIQQKAEQLRLEEINRLQQQIAEMNRTAKEQQSRIDRQNVTMDRVKRITEMKSFSYTVLATGTSKNKQEKVVYVNDVPDSSVDQETYLLRASIEFANEPEFTISLWRDKELAIRYIQGDYNEEETIVGWSGFSARFGVIRQTEEERRLLLFLSMDDIDNLEFGAYTNQER